MSQSERLLLHIDGRPIEVEKGLTILQAARQNGIEIPTLCDFPGLPSHGSCRMCIVEIQGRQNTPTSCTTPAEAGMVVYTHSPKVQSLRAELLQMLLAEHPSACLFCPENGNCDECMVTVRKSNVTTGCGSCPKDEQCELQALVEEYQVQKPVYPTRYRGLPVEKHDPFFDRDDNLCILCGRCVRVCEDLHFVSTLTYTRRGIHALVGTAFHRTHLESSCTFCGSCVEVCPTGALSEKTRKWDGKPQAETTTTCSLCSMGCQINLLSKNGRVIGSLPNRQSETDVLCVKGRFGITELVNHPTRLKKALKRADGTQQPIGMDEAIQIAAQKLAACSPERFAMRISASCTNEDLFAAAKFTREVIGSEHVLASAQTHYGNGLAEVGRLAAASQSLDALTAASSILCFGLEDRFAQSVVEVHLHRARQRGASIVLVSPQKTTWSDYASVWLQTDREQETALVHALVQLTGGDVAEQSLQPSLVQTAHLLQQGAAPAIILGPSVLASADNRRFLQAVEQLVRNLGAAVIVLPDEANLAGALRLGLCAPAKAPDLHDLDVLYLVGEAVPENLPENVFVIYQNLYPPIEENRVDLVLPLAAFTEEEGIFTDYAGSPRVIHPAVDPKGEARPAWLVFSQLAQAIGSDCMPYADVEDLRQAMLAVLADGALSLSVRSDSEADLDPKSINVDEPVYMGYPLSNWVGGLQDLYPRAATRSAHESNS